MKLENGKLVADFSRHDLLGENRDDREVLNNYVKMFATDVGGKQDHQITLFECIALSCLNSKAKGFWDAERNHGESYMLIVSELAEAFEELRNGEDADIDHICEELADVFIRQCDYIGGFGLTDRFFEALKKKFIKNTNRPYKHGKTF